MTITPQTTWIAFARSKRIAAGAPAEVVAAVKTAVDARPEMPVTVFDAVTSQTVELDLRGSLSAVLKRLPKPVPEQSEPELTEPAPRGAGRPKLGVVAREVTLLPRHWDWLAGQPGGISVALRKLVEHAQRAGREQDRARQARDYAYRFMSAMAGDAPGFEEASRALFAGDLARLQNCAAKWPADVRKHALALAEKIVVSDSAPAE